MGSNLSTSASFPPGEQRCAAQLPRSCSGRTDAQHRPAACDKREFPESDRSRGVKVRGSLVEDVTVTCASQGSGPRLARWPKRSLFLLCPRWAASLKATRWE